MAVAGRCLPNSPRETESEGRERERESSGANCRQNRGFQWYDNIRSCVSHLPILPSFPDRIVSYHS